MIRRHIRVRGRVQGVGFRYSARAEALRLGLSGRARNLPDGTVEVEIEGDETPVEAMLEWLASGPPGSAVAATDVSEREPTGETGFHIGG